MGDDATYLGIRYGSRARGFGRDWRAIGARWSLECGRDAVAMRCVVAARALMVAIGVRLG
jgi:hypothetical protein